MTSNRYLIYSLSSLLIYAIYYYLPKFYHSLTSYECKTTVLAIGIASWSGKCVEGIAEGQGVVSSANKELYSGSMLHGKPHGLGKMQLANNDYYEGQFENGIPSGFGVLMFATPTPMVGTHDKGWFVGQSGFFDKGVINGAGSILLKYEGNDYALSGIFKQGLFQVDSVPKVPAYTNSVPSITNQQSLPSVPMSNYNSEADKLTQLYNRQQQDALHERQLDLIRESGRLQRKSNCSFYDKKWAGDTLGCVEPF